MGTQESTLIMRLIDGVTGPSQTVSGSLTKLAGQLGAAFSAYKVAQFAKEGFIEAADEQTRWERLRQRLGMTSAEVDKTREAVFQMGQTFGINRETMIQGFDDLAVGGKTLEDVMAVLPRAAAASTAFGMSIGEAGRTNRAFTAQLKIPVEDSSRAWNMLAEAAHQGTINVKTLAATIPELGTSAALMGYTGLPGLQKILAVGEAIAPKFGSAEEAMGGLETTMRRMAAPSMITAMKKQGVDIMAEYAKGAEKSQDRFEVLYNTVNRLTGGDMSKATAMFGRQIAAILPVLVGIHDSKNQIAANTDAITGTGDRMEQAATRYAASMKASLENLAGAWKELREEVGRGLMDIGAGPDAFTTWLKETIQDVRNLAGEINSWRKYFGGKLTPEAELSAAKYEKMAAESAKKQLVEAGPSPLEQKIGVNLYGQTNEQAIKEQQDKIDKADAEIARLEGVIQALDKKFSETFKKPSPPVPTHETVPVRVEPGAPGVGRVSARGPGGRPLIARRIIMPTPRPEEVPQPPPETSLDLLRAAREKPSEKPREYMFDYKALLSKLPFEIKPIVIPPPDTSALKQPIVVPAPDTSALSQPAVVPPPDISAAKSVVQELQDTVAQLAPAIPEMTVPKPSLSALADAAAEAGAKGREIGENVVSGIMSSISAEMPKVKSAIQSALSGITASVGIKVNTNAQFPDTPAPGKSN